MADPFLVSIVIHTASSIEPQFALHLITALGKRKELTGQDTYLIHVIIHLLPLRFVLILNARQTSGLSAFYEKTGWPHGEFTDSGPVFDMEKQLADSFPIRKVISRDSGSCPINWQSSDFPRLTWPLLSMRKPEG